ncbi:hypothetical protein KRX54_01940 [Actinomycetaceae bacterium TAE3-ERU4]|nr:hypothetical protein [Actinomycetaceae bacterium TAE3-ERU4]
MQTAKVKSPKDYNRVSGMIFSTIWVVFLVFPLYFALKYVTVPWRLTTILVLLALVAIIFPLASYRLNKQNPYRPKNSAALSWVATILLIVFALTISVVAQSYDYLQILIYPYAVFIHTQNIKTGIFFLGTNFLLAGLALHKYWSISLLVALSWPMVMSALIMLMHIAESLSRISTENAHRIAINEERQRIARDIHDLLGHSLTVISLKAQLLERLSNNPQLSKEAKEIQTLARQGLTQVRQTVTELKAPSLAETLKKSISVLETAGIKIKIIGSYMDIPQASEPVAAWTIKESTTNILRHAHAKNVKIIFCRDSLKIIDDGIGIPNLDSSQDLFNDHLLSTSKTGNGLIGIAARAAAINANLHLANESSKGLSLEVTWPTLKEV